MRAMRKRLIAMAIAAAIVFILFSPLLFRKRTVPLRLNDRVVAVAKRPSVAPWSDSEISVYMGESNVLTLWEDISNGPLLIYPLSDGERFLCIYDHDVEDFAFVVDFSASATDVSHLPKWPSDNNNRAAMAMWATSVVLKTKGFVRSPNYGELQTASNELANLTPRQFRTLSFPRLDLGIHRVYAPKEQVLFNLRTNREF